MPREKFPIPLTFSDEYKNQAFYLWYNSGKPTVPKMTLILESDNFGHKPSRKTLRDWIREDFRPRADKMDEQVEQEIEAKLVQSKIEMLERHAQLGREAQDKAWEFLNNECFELSEAGAIRLLEFGVKLEQSTSSIPGMMRKVMNMKDDELVDKIKELVAKTSTIAIEQEENYDEGEN
jgi:hypothetical protein